MVEEHSDDCEGAQPVEARQVGEAPTLAHAPFGRPPDDASYRRPVAAVSGGWPGAQCMARACPPPCHKEANNSISTLRPCGLRLSARSGWRLRFSARRFAPFQHVAFGDLSAFRLFVPQGRRWVLEVLSRLPSGRLAFHGALLLEDEVH